MRSCASCPYYEGLVRRGTHVWCPRMAVLTWRRTFGALDDLTLPPTPMPEGGLFGTLWEASEGHHSSASLLPSPPRHPDQTKCSQNVGGSPSLELHSKSHMRVNKVWILGSLMTPFCVVEGNCNEISALLPHISSQLPSFILNSGVKPGLGRWQIGWCFYSPLTLTL